jgi:type III restriction enzyme
MVRNPLARRIASADFLNTVALYLPHYDAAGLDRVVERLTAPDPETMPPVEVRSGENQVEVTRVPGLQKVFEAIENLPSYTIPIRRKSNQVRRLMKLARALANDEIEVDAEISALDMLLGVLTTEYARVSKTDLFRKIVHDRKAEIRTVDWQVGLDVTEEEAMIILDLSGEDIDAFFEMAGRRIGDEGLHKVWWKARIHTKVDSITARLELIALSINSTVRKKLEDASQKRVQDWLRAHKDAINRLPEVHRQVYDEIRARAKDPELRSPIVLPNSMLVKKSEDVWDRNVYADENGTYPGNLNKWESAVVRRELERNKRIVWFRNIPRKPSSLSIPYIAGGKPAAFYPDFIFARIENGTVVIDLLDPHHMDLEDAPAKAAGLAQYAAKHAESYNRIELIIVRNDGEIRSIDLTDEVKRDKVRGVATKTHLAQLFEEGE